MEHHGSSSACPTFKFRVIGSFKDPLRRQLLEAIKITYSGTLNKRNEHGHNEICRLLPSKSQREEEQMVEKSRREKLNFRISKILLM